MSDLLVTTYERMSMPRRYTVSFSEGAAMTVEYESVYDAFASVVSNIVRGERHELICDVSGRDDSITGTITVWEGKIRRQHHVSIKPWRAAA